MIRLPLPAISIWLSLGAIAGWWLHDFYSRSTDSATSLSPKQVADITAQIENTAKTNFVSRLNTLLESGDYELALAHLHEANISDQAEASRNRSRFISSLAELSSEKPDEAQSILRGFLETDAYDPRALFLLGKAYHNTGQHMRALETLLELKRLNQAEVSAEDISVLIGKVENEYVQQLESNEQLEELLHLYEFLTRHDPDDTKRFYKLAEVQQRLHHYHDALSSLNYVLFDTAWGKLAQDMAEKIQKSIDLDDEVQIPLQRSGNQFIVTARINGIDGARLMIDTGASLCVLRPQSALQFGVPVESDSEITLNLVSAVFNAPRVTIDSMSIGDVELSNVQTAIIEMPPGTEGDGLLGMNFLSEFRFFIDQSQGILYLGSK